MSEVDAVVSSAVTRAFISGPLWILMGVTTGVGGVWAVGLLITPEVVVVACAISVEKIKELEEALINIGAPENCFTSLTKSVELPRGNKPYEGERMDASIVRDVASAWALVQSCNSTTTKQILLSKRAVLETVNPKL